MERIVLNVTGYGSTGNPDAPKGTVKSGIGGRLRQVAEQWAATYGWREGWDLPSVEQQLAALGDQLRYDLRNNEVIVVANGFGVKLMAKLLEREKFSNLDTLLMLNPSLTLDGLRRVLGPFWDAAEWYSLRFGFPRINPGKSVKIPPIAVRWMLDHERDFDWQRIARNLPANVVLLSNEMGRDKIHDPKSDSVWMAEQLGINIHETDNAGVFTFTRQRLQALANPGAV